MAPTKKPSAQSSSQASASKQASPFQPPPGGPNTLAEWRARFPGPDAARTIDELVVGLERARQQGSSTLHSYFEDDNGVPVAEQPTDPYEWLCGAKRLPLAALVPFQKTLLPDIAPLGIFTQVRMLTLSVAPDTQLDALASLRALTWLDISGGESSSWDFLGSLEALQKLGITATPGASSDAPSPRLSLSKNTRLREFSYNGPLTSVEFLAGAPQLEKLELTGQTLADLSPLREQASLERLDLFGNRISDVSPLRSMQKLEFLDLRLNDLSDVTPLFSLSSLSELDISRNRVVSLTGLEKLGSLSTLEADFNCISDFEPVKKWLTDEDEATAWIEGTEPTQLSLESPTAQALYADWLNLEKWEAHATFLEAQGSPLAKQIRLRLKNEKSRLPWFWARGTTKRDPSWK